MSILQRTLADSRAEVRRTLPQSNEAWSWLRDEEAAPSSPSVAAQPQTLEQ